jgi:hypothetical protein
VCVVVLGRTPRRRPASRGTPSSRRARFVQSMTCFMGTWVLPLSVLKALVHLVVLCVSCDGQRAVKQAREKMAEKLGASAQTAKVRHTKHHLLAIQSLENRMGRPSGFVQASVVAGGVQS